MKSIYFFLWGYLLLACLLMSCEESEEERKLQARREQQLWIAKQKAEAAKSAKEAEEKRAKRDAKGDTVALSSEALEKYLPTEYKTYKKQGDAIISLPERNGGASSSVEQTYSTEGKNIRIIIRDSNQGVNNFVGIGKMWLKKPALDNKKVRASYVKILKKFHAWQYFEKKTGRAGLQIEISDRIYIEILATGQASADAVQEFATKIDLEKLSEY